MRTRAQNKKLTQAAKAANSISQFQEPRLASIIPPSSRTSRKTAGSSRLGRKKRAHVPQELDDKTDGDAESGQEDQIHPASTRPTPHGRLSRNAKKRALVDKEQVFEDSDEELPQYEPNNQSDGDSDYSLEIPKNKNKKVNKAETHVASIRGRKTKPKTTKTKVVAKKRLEDADKDALVVDLKPDLAIKKKTTRPIRSAKAAKPDSVVTAGAAASKALAQLQSPPITSSSSKKKYNNKKRRREELVTGKLFESLSKDLLGRIIRWATMPSSEEVDDKEATNIDVAASAVALLQVDGKKMGEAAVTEFSKGIIDTDGDAQPAVSGQGLIISSKPTASSEASITTTNTIAILGEFTEIHKYTLVRGSGITVPIKYVRALGRCKIRELDLCVSNDDLGKILEATKGSLKKLTVLVNPLDYVVVTAISTHGTKLEHLILKFNSYDIHFSHTLLNIAAAAKESLRRFDVVGNLLEGRENDFLEMDKAKKVAPKCALTYNAAVIPTPKN